MPSAAIRSFDYDASRHELTVRFAGGVAYVYSLVPARLVGELEAAPSRGAFVNQRIKDRYPFRKVGEASVRRRAEPVRRLSLKERLGASLAEDEN